MCIYRNDIYIDAITYEDWLTFTKQFGVLIVLN